MFKLIKNNQAVLATGLALLVWVALMVLTVAKLPNGAF